MCQSRTIALNSVCSNCLNYGIISNRPPAKGDIQSNIKAIYHNKEFVNTTEGIPADAQVGVLLDKTNFYAEQGGQDHDTGRILIDGEAELEVTNVQSYGGYVLHTGYMKYGALKVDDAVISEYDEV